MGAVGRRLAGAIGAAAVAVVACAGCLGLGDDAEPSASTRPGETTTVAGAAGTTTAPATTLAPLDEWPAGVVWGDFADGAATSDLPDDGISTAVASADGPDGRVAVGRSSLSSGALGSVADLSTAMIWYRDGDTWQLANTGLSNGTSALYDVAAWGDGYVAVGFHADAYERHASAIVLTSSDGRTWRLATRLPTIWSGWGSRVRALPSGQVLVDVSMAVCLDDASFVNEEAPLSTPSIWTAGAPNGTYVQMPAGSVPADPPLRPTPTDAAGCLGEFGAVPEDERAAQFGSSIGDIAVVGDRLAVLEPDASAVAITSDLEHWTRVPLPEPVADPLGALLYADADGRVNVVAVSERPLGTGYVPGTLDPDAWVSTVWVEDASGALRRVEPWRPLYTVGWTFSGLEQAGDVVRLVAAAATDRPGDPPVLKIAESRPSVPMDEPTCEPAPLANCSFVSLDGAQLAGADLTGIQLYGATISGSDLRYAKLDGAQLSGAAISDSTFVGASFTTARLRATTIAGSDLTSAVLAYADLSAATLTGSTLAGASLASAVTDGAVVDAATTCPDQMPPGDGDSPVLVTACRLS